MSIRSNLNTAFTAAINAGRRYDTPRHGTKRSHEQSTGGSTEAYGNSHRAVDSLLRVTDSQSNSSETPSVGTAQMTSNPFEDLSEKEAVATDGVKLGLRLGATIAPSPSSGSSGSGQSGMLSCGPQPTINSQQPPDTAGQLTLPWRKKKVSELEENDILLRATMPTAVMETYLKENLGAAVPESQWTLDFFTKQAGDSTPRLTHLTWPDFGAQLEEKVTWDITALDHEMTVAVMSRTDVQELFSREQTPPPQNNPPPTPTPQRNALTTTPQLYTPPTSDTPMIGSHSVEQHSRGNPPGAQSQGEQRGGTILTKMHYIMDLNNIPRPTTDNKNVDNIRRKLSGLFRLWTIVWIQAYLNMGTLNMDEFREQFTNAQMLTDCSMITATKETKIFGRIANIPVMEDKELFSNFLLFEYDLFNKKQMSLQMFLGTDNDIPLSTLQAREPNWNHVNTIITALRNMSRVEYLCRSKEVADEWEYLATTIEEDPYGPFAYVATEILVAWIECIMYSWNFKVYRKHLQDEKELIDATGCAAVLHKMIVDGYQQLSNQHMGHAFHSNVFYASKGIHGRIQGPKSPVPGTTVATTTKAATPTPGNNTPTPVITVNTKPCIHHVLNQLGAKESNGQPHTCGKGTECTYKHVDSIDTITQHTIQQVESFCPAQFKALLTKYKEELK